MAPPRIIAGELRGRRLVVPAGNTVRPTKDRVKAAIFSALDARGLLLDAVVVDAFAGSGALGFEALSRGATHVTFVERDPRALAAIEHNATSFGVRERVRIVAGDAGRSGTTSADLVFADPPYDCDAGERDAAITRLAAQAPEGTVVVEGPARGWDVHAPDGWEVVWERTFGDTLVIFLQPAPDAPPRD